MSTDDGFKLHQQIQASKQMMMVFWLCRSTNHKTLKTKEEEERRGRETRGARVCFWREGGSRGRERVVAEGDGVLHFIFLLKRIMSTLNNSLETVVV